MPLNPQVAADLKLTPSEVPIPDRAHLWVINAQVPVDHKQAKTAAFRGSLRVKVQTRIDALDVMCRNCRRPFDDVADDDCEAKIDNQHLIGGDQRERAKRKKFTPPPGVVVTPAPRPRINRYGIDAVLRREA